MSSYSEIEGRIPKACEAANVLNTQIYQRCRVNFDVPYQELWARFKG